MGKYYDQALQFSQNADAIIEYLDSALSESDELNSLLDGSNAQYDYVTKRVITGNEEIKKKINAIQEKLAAISNQLKNEGKTIDDRIEEENKRKANNVVNNKKEEDQEVKEISPKISKMAKTWIASRRD